MEIMERVLRAEKQLLYLVLVGPGGAQTAPGAQVLRRAVKSPTKRNIKTIGTVDGQRVLCSLIVQAEGALPGGSRTSHSHCLRHPVLQTPKPSTASL